MLYCIMGKSSTGKDTIFKRLLGDDELMLNNLVSYTTRPIRENEIDGVEYYFVDTRKRDELMAAGKIIELRCYETCYGPWEYFTADDSKVSIDEKNYIIIATLESYEKLRNYYGKERVCPIYIEVEDGIRLTRALMREKKQPYPRYDEMCRRFLSDTKDFAPDKLKMLGVDKVFVNNNINHVVSEIARYIRDSMSR